MKRQPCRKGFTLIEIIVASSLAVVILGFGYLLISTASKAYHQVSGHDDGELQMKKLSRAMQKDLTESAFGGIMVAPVLDSSVRVGDAISCLSFQSGSNADGAPCTNLTGSPFWQRNVLYYLVRPQGDSCTVQAGVDGYEDNCPHKVAIRKIIDSGVSTKPLSQGGVPAADSEQPLTDLKPYLTKPTAQLSVQHMLGETKVTSVSVAAVNLLSLKIRLATDPNSPWEVETRILSYNRESNRQAFAVGKTALSPTDGLLAQGFSCFPRNRYFLKP